MEKSPLYNAIGKLAIAGEQAGFSVEHMIRLLKAGITIETLLDMIENRLPSPDNSMRSFRWIIEDSTMLPDPTPGWEQPARFAVRTRNTQRTARLGMTRLPN